MDIPRASSPPSIHVYDFNGSHGPRRSSSRSFTNSLSNAQRPMAIPNSRADFPQAPPPLPPPRHIDDDAAGGIQEIQWRDSFSSGSAKSGGSVNFGSSLRGNWGQNMAHRGSAGRPDFRRGSSNSTVRSRPEEEKRYDFSRHMDEGYYSLSGSSLANQQLHSERHLERRNVVDSSQAYDNKLLSKLGKPKTPPESARGSVDVASPTSSLSFYQSGRHPLPLKSLSLSEGSRGQAPDSPFKQGSPFSGYMGSPRSRVMSPSLISSARSAQSHTDIRSPSSATDSSVPPSAVDPYPPPQRHYSSPNITPHHHSHLSGTGSVFSNWDDSAEGSIKSEHASLASAGVVKRGSQDQSIDSEPDSSAGDFPMEDPGVSDTSALRRLHLDDTANPSSRDSAPSPHYIAPVTTADARISGMKRGASSPPPEAPRGDKVPLHAVGGNAASHLTMQSPINPYAQPHGSFSSASSIGFRNGSYASSTGLSAGASSITSISSHERLSPRGISPSSEYQQNAQNLQFPPPQSMNPSPRESLPGTHQRIPSDSKSAAAIARTMSSDSTAQRKSSAPSLQAHVHICKCCPKKPKKFDTLEELRAHASEKQYSCQYCENRFKNKNEAERHQNSLHLRRHSWSCATLATTYERAFHPPSTNLPNPNNPNSQLSASNELSHVDICGYCGKEFSTVPQPDWEDRIGHLNNVHKFGECNQSKKFFRADHFRQHLKHSHAGTSGKWTNQLEAACMKEEPPIMGPDLILQQQQGAPIANMAPIQQPRGMMMMSGQPGMPVMTGMREDRIDEMHEGL